MSQTYDVFDSPDFDPDAFLDRLVYAEPGPEVGLPVPPRLTEADEVIVRRTYELPADVDARLRELAAARHMTVEEFVKDWAQHAA
jgi:hypothetical protein